MGEEDSCFHIPLIMKYTENKIPREFSEAALVNKLALLLCRHTARTRYSNILGMKMELIEAAI